MWPNLIRKTKIVPEYSPLQKWEKNTTKICWRGKKGVWETAKDTHITKDQYLITKKIQENDRLKLVGTKRTPGELSVLSNFRED